MSAIAERELASFWTADVDRLDVFATKNETTKYFTIPNLRLDESGDWDMALAKIAKSSSLKTKIKEASLSDSELGRLSEASPPPASWYAGDEDDDL